MKDIELLTDKEMDFLREMLNIGAGNAAGAFVQMLNCPVDVKIPEIYFFPASDIPPFLKDPAKSFATVSMNMVGDVNGRLFFLVPAERNDKLIELVKRATPGHETSGCVGADPSVLEELGNILAGVFLVSIHDFCKLNIYHSVPDLRSDMLQALIDESIAAATRESSQIILAVSTFIIVGENIKTFFLIIPDMKSTKKLLNSISDARKQMYGN
ncbi:MAG: chemotaxis protein CheC [Deltaproteobacteria bacterium]|nr:chemotaxis protein CheC [Deltaproteobacteria bacterium]